MPNAPFYNGNTNPNAKGGAFGYDGRTGLGIGSLTKGPASGLGSNWNMGDALSSPKGQWDDIEIEDEKDLNSTFVGPDTTVRDLAILAGLIEKSEEFDELEADIESKAHSAFHRGAVDSLSHKGTSIGYMGGIGSDMSAVIGLSAGYEPDGNIMFEEKLKQYIKETLLFERRNGHMSGSIAVRSAGHGSMYKNVMASTNTADAAPQGHLPTSRSAINHSGYGQSVKTPDMHPYSKSGKPTTDGAETLGSNRAKMSLARTMNNFNSGMSTGEDLFSSLEKEIIDLLNVEVNKQNKF